MNVRNGAEIGRTAIRVRQIEEVFDPCRYRWESWS